MRKAVVGLMLAFACLVLAAAAADARESLQGTSKSRARGQIVTYSGTTSQCRSVYLRSTPGGRRTALNPQRKRVRNGRFSFRKVVRRQAAQTTYRVIASCGKHRIGTVSLKVVPRRMAHTGASILPQLVLGVGLLGTGGVLLAVSRRHQLLIARPRVSHRPPVGRKSSRRHRAIRYPYAD